MAISASGIGSGLDVDGLVSQLMALERRPLTTLAQREAGVQAKISAFGTIASAVSGLQTAANALNDAAKFAATKATPGANAGFSATTAAGARAGTYSIQVNQLAASQRVAIAGDAFALNGDNIAAGALNIAFGSADALANGTPETTKTLNFAGGSVRELRDAINAAGLGISANVVNDGSTDRLVLSGSATGAEQAFSLNGLGIAFSPDAPGNEGDPIYGLQAAQDARVSVDGLSISRATNIIEGVIEGVTLTLNTKGDSATTLTVAADPGGARTAIEGFVNAYNAATRSLANLTRYDPETRQASVLTGDSTARSVQAQLRSIVGGAFSGLGGTERLSSIGVSFQLDGTLAIDSGKLNAALSDPAQNVAGFFSGNGEVQGFGARVSSALSNLVGSGGLITGRTEGLKTTVQGMLKQAEALNARLESVEKRYRTQFSALDVLISNMTQTSNYLQQQLANLPGANRN